MPDFVRFWDVVQTLTASPLDVDVCLVLPLRSDPERASLEDVQDAALTALLDRAL